MKYYLAEVYVSGKIVYRLVMAENEKKAREKVLNEYLEGYHVRITQTII